MKTRTLHVAPVASFTNEQLVAAFSKFGEVSIVSRSHSVALVRFSTFEAAEQVLALSETALTDGRRLELLVRVRPAPSASNAMLFLWNCQEEIPESELFEAIATMIGIEPVYLHRPVGRSIAFVGFADAEQAQQALPCLNRLSVRGFSIGARAYEQRKSPRVSQDRPSEKAALWDREIGHRFHATKTRLPSFKHSQRRRRDTSWP